MDQQNDANLRNLQQDEEFQERVRTFREFLDNDVNLANLVWTE